MCKGYQGTGQVIVLSCYLLIASGSVHADGLPPSSGAEAVEPDTSRAALGNTETLSQAGSSGNALASVELNEEIPIERAEGETLAEAIGRYARAKSLLVAAIREFDAATKIAKPDAVLNTAAWRSDLISRAEELNHLLAPQARITRGGVRYEGDSRLLSPGTGK